MSAKPFIILLADALVCQHLNYCNIAILTDSVEQYRGLDAELYDSDYATYDPSDIAFYVEEATNCGSTVLELGCGTGRITIPIANAGIDIVGVEISPDMLEIARAKVAEMPSVVADRITLAQGDMCDFDLGRTFDLVLIPFRVFICLMTVEEQKQALRNIHRHMNDGAKLIINFFDPDLREILDHNERMRSNQILMNQFRHPSTGNPVKEWSTWDYDLTEQTIEEVRNYVEQDFQGNILKSTTVKLRVRYIFRWEMYHLLELCGFRVETLYGDFDRSPFKARAEQIWVAVK